MKTFCIKCNKKHSSIYGWRNKGKGWYCIDKPSRLPEFVPQSIINSRKKYRKDILQPFRQGEFSKEFKDAYPLQAKKMLQEGHITQKQYRNAKEVWKGDI